MKQFQLFPIIIAIFAMIITACGAQPEPTMSPADVQFTAVAAAFTIVAETQAAIPTATPLPPTEPPTQTPLPTETPLALPTVGALSTLPPTTSSGGGDPCDNRILSWSPAGRSTKIQIINTTKVEISVSIYLNETADKGECGWRTYTIGKKNDIVITDLVQGCYNVWAWSDDPKGRFNSSGYGCINNNDKWSFEVSSAVIKAVGP